MNSFEKWADENGLEFGARYAAKEGWKECLQSEEVRDLVKAALSVLMGAKPHDMATYSVLEDWRVKKLADSLAPFNQESKDDE